MSVNWVGAVSGAVSGASGGGGGSSGGGGGGGGGGMYSSEQNYLDDTRNTVNAGNAGINLGGYSPFNSDSPAPSWPDSLRRRAPRLSVSNPSPVLLGVSLVALLAALWMLRRKG